MQEHVNWIYFIPYVLGVGAGWVGCMIAVGIYNLIDRGWD